MPCAPVAGVMLRAGAGFDGAGEGEAAEGAGGAPGAEGQGGRVEKGPSPERGMQSSD